MNWSMTMATRKSPEARELQIERRNAERYGRRAQNRHARQVKRYEISAADAAFRATFGEV
jgi:hypothetical protein